MLPIIFSHAQGMQLTVEEDADNGSERTVIVAHNIASGSHASTGFVLKSGDAGTMSTATIDVSNTLYTALPNISGYLNLTSGSNSTEGKGINFRCAKPYGNFRYYIGGYTDSDVKMILDSNGNLGLGNINPSSRLQITGGDIYIEDIGSGVIMKSPNGNCWRLTVDNSGNVVTTTIVCP